MRARGPTVLRPVGHLLPPGREKGATGGRPASRERRRRGRGERRNPLQSSKGSVSTRRPTMKASATSWKGATSTALSPARSSPAKRR